MSYSVLYQDIGIKDYKEAWDLQENVFRKIISRKIALHENNPVDVPAQPGTLILVEHPHVYTLGKSGSEDNLLIDHIQLQTRDAQFFRTNRGEILPITGRARLSVIPSSTWKRSGSA